MDANKALLFAQILGVAGGLGIVAVIILLFLELRKNRDKTEGEITVAPPPAPPLADTLSQFFKRPAPAPPPNTHEVLRVARDNLTGRLIVELAGQRFNRFEEIGDDALRQALLTTVRDLDKFAGAALPATVSAPVVSPALAAPPPPAPIIQPNAVPTALPTPPVAAAPTAPPPLPKPSMNPFKQRQILREMERRPAPVFKSIPEIIDEHLQQKLLGTPHIWRGIRVKPGPKDSVLFEVDGQAYDSVDAVPDEAVRTLLREAIAEWDAKK